MKKDKKLIFIRFLFGKGLLKQYKKNLKKKPYSTTLKEWLDKPYPYQWIIGAFNWSETKEGLSFWEDVNNEWVEILKKRVEK